MSEQSIKWGSYTLNRTSPRSFPVEQYPHLYIIVLVLTWSSWLLYFASELHLACRIIHNTNRPTREVWITITAEFALTFQELVLALGLLIGLASSRSQDPRPSYELIGELAPSVDVLITCCGEAIDVILDTVKAAAAQDYPSSAYRILVLDDGHDDELRQGLTNLKPWLKGRNLASAKYLSRDVKKGHKSFFKAGNLKYGIELFSDGGSSSEFVAGLDCDMIAEPNWLRHCVAHMLLRDKIGMVVSPQVRYLHKHLAGQVVSDDYA